MNDELGILSRDEQEIAESETTRTLRVQLEDEEFEADQYVHWYRKRLMDFPYAEKPMELIESYAYWTARLALVRDKRERMGL